MNNDQLAAKDHDLKDELLESLRRLGEFSVRLTFSDLSYDTKEAVRRVLFDDLVAIIAGGQLEESARLRGVLPLSDGPASIFGTRSTAGVVDAAWLNGVSMVSLELDEGNKYIRGHASAHVLPACIALAESIHASGKEFLNAFVVGHEIASRFGAAVRLYPDIHPHGNWGVTGAAAACARLGGGGPLDISKAIDNGGVSAIATPFSVATAGMVVRNGWIGLANSAGVWASYIALADREGPLVGACSESLGGLLGTIEPEKLSQEIGSHFFVESGYFKRHASCSYTHPPADAAIEIFNKVGSVFPDMVNTISVETHHLAAGLTSLVWPTRMAAMFSIPFVVATALEVGNCGPEQFSRVFRTSGRRIALASKIQVLNDAGIDKRLPNFRACRLRITWSDGTESVLEVDNPVGDRDNQPFDQNYLFEKGVKLLGNEIAEAVLQTVQELPNSPDVSSLFADLREVTCSEGGGK